MRLLRVFTLILLMLWPPCAVLGQAPWPTEEWPTASPKSQGLRPAKLTELVDLIRVGKSFPALHSLLIVRHGHIVVEEYFAGTRSDQLHTLQSVSKSFTSALIGIAIEQGKITSVEEKAVGFFPEYSHKIAHMNERKAAMTLEDLLTMRSGSDYHESPYRGSPHEELNNLSKGWDRFVLDRKMIRQPGTEFQYDSGAVILMSSILKNRTGMHADGFAERYLFAPMGVSQKRWFRNQEGHPHTGGGLDLRPRDMAKFGLLYLRNGRWEDSQVVPAEWVETSTRLHVEFEKRADRKTIGYGYLWWILRPDPQGDRNTLIYAAMGFRAQYIFVIPEHDMIVVVTGGTQSSADQNKPIGFLYSHILPAIVR